MAIAFDPTVGLRANVCTSFQRPFSLGLLWNRKSVTRRSGRPNFSNELKWSYLWIRTLYRAQIFA
jgi:hypothetical protein